MTRIIKADEAGAPQGSKAAVLKLADLAAEARELVLGARKEAARIVAEARAKAEESQRQATEKGYADGYARGQETGYAEARQQGLAESRQALATEAAELVPLARKAVDQLNRAWAELVENAGRQIVSLAADIAEKVVGRIARGNVDAALANLGKALELANRNSQWTVLVHPDQLGPLRASFPELMESLGLSGEVRWVGDVRIGRGGVKVLTPHGEIDATIETQLANVVEALTGSARGQGGSPADDSYVSQDAASRPKRPAATPAPTPDAPPRDSHKVIRPVSAATPREEAERA